MFRNGPGATRTRDLLLRSAGPSASHRQPALIYPVGRGRSAECRSPSLTGIVIKSVINDRLLRRGIPRLTDDGLPPTHAGVAGWRSLGLGGWLPATLPQSRSIEADGWPWHT